MKHTAIGLMSGTSLDGTDLAYCIFEKVNSTWDFKIIKTQTLPYSSTWESKLRNAPDMSGQELIKTHVEYGHYLGKLICNFIKESRLKTPDLVASHGHTVYHQPENGFTFQMGDGSSIAAETKCTVVCDFRSLNVASGGQGAPLVPIGDELLFEKYDYCLNLGGFANISYKISGKRIAFDICPVNFVINTLVKNRNKEAQKILSNDYGNKTATFDPDGKIASNGKVSVKLVEELNKLNYYKQKPPKSLGAEWVTKNVLPIINKYNHLPLEDILRSFYEHITCQVKNITANNNKKSILITGGGAYNKFLIKLFENNLNIKLCIPDNNIIEYKEALIFAFLGVLRINKMPNILKSASGGHINNISGGIYEGK